MEKYSKEFGEQIGNILKPLQSLNCPPETEEGNLDIAKFNELPEVIEVKTKLQEIGMDSRSELFNAGFMSAGLVLTFDN